MHMLLSKLIVVVTIASVTTSVSSNKNCIGSNNCPVWPREFDSPFGLYSPFPSIKNASSTFYYKFLENGTQAQLISYDNRCFPFVNAKSAVKAICLVNFFYLLLLVEYRLIFLIFFFFRPDIHCSFVIPSKPTRRSVPIVVFLEL